MKQAFGWFIFMVLMFALVALCETVPIIGYPVAAIIVLRLIFGRHGKSRSVSEVLDTEPYDHNQHHHHH